MNAKIELRPCPFCGKAATIRQRDAGYRNREFAAGYEVGCNECKIYFKDVTRLRLENGQPVFLVNGYDRCIERWNRRASDEARS